MDCCPHTSISASFADATSIIPIEINPAVKGVAVSNMTFFLNHTDGHYHLKGLVKNVSHLSVGYTDVQLSFQDKQSRVIENESKSDFFVVGPIRSYRNKTIRHQYWHYCRTRQSVSTSKGCDNIG